jgi:hypothetical protein
MPHGTTGLERVKHKTDTALAPYKDVYKDTQKKIKQLGITSFCIMYSVFLPVVHATTFNQPNNFKPRSL